ncbi:hypothetical protein Tco_0542377 [Tanacetum coccineum]
MHQPWRTFAAIINRCIFGKTTRLDRLRESQAQILWGMYNKKNVDYVALLWEDFMYQANNREIGLARKEHMPYTRFTKVIINHFISKDKTISMMKIINLHTIRDDSLLERFLLGKQGSIRKLLYPFKEAEPVRKGKRVKRPTKKSTTAPTVGVAIRDTPGASVSKKKARAKANRSKGDGTDFELGLPDEQQRKTSGIDEGTDDDDENPSFTLKDYDEEEHDEEYESDDDYENMFEKEDDDDLYKDVDVGSLGTDHEKERKGDEEMTDGDKNVSQELTYEQVVEDAHVTLTASQKTDDSKQSSSVSFDFASKFLILENVPPVIDEVASMMYVKSRQEESSNQAPSLFIVPVTAIQETATWKLPRHKNDVEIVNTRWGKSREKREKDLGKLVKDIIKDEVKSLLPQILPKEVSDFATPVIQSTISESLENVVLAKSSSQLQSTYKAATSLIEFVLKKILIDKLEKSKLYRAAKEHRNHFDALIKSYQLDKDLFDSYGKSYSLKRSRDDKDKDEDPSAGSDQCLSKGTKSQPKSSGKSVQAEEPVFETVDTEMLQVQGGDTEEQPNVKTTPIDDFSRNLRDLQLLTLNRVEVLAGKTKAARYDNIEGIKDMVPELWSPVKGAYDKFAMWGISHWVMKWYGYVYLEEIIVRREDQSLHKFKEGNFPRLNLRDIEDLLLLLVQKKLSNLEQYVIIDLNVALRMFTRCIVILKWVEDLQLGVKSYQKKLNIIKLKTFSSGISKLTPYTAYKNPQGVIYQDKFKRNRLMHSDELYKIWDGTLTSVRRNQRDLPRDIPLDSVEVLRYEKKEKSDIKGKLPTKIELVLEHTQQGTSYEVLISTEGVKELKRKVKIKSEKKEALLTLRQKLEHQSDTKVIHKGRMEILLDPTSNKLLVERFNTLAGNPVKEILLKLNLPDHRFTQRWSWSDEVLKLKNIKKDGYTRFQHQEQYEHVGPEVTRSQEGKRSQDDDKRLCLVDDLKEVQVHIQVKPIRTSSSLKS